MGLFDKVAERMIEQMKYVFTCCPHCGHDLETALFLEAYGEMRSLKIIEGAYVPVYITCESCLTEYTVEITLTRNTM